MDILSAIILGITQGVAEFLPISSSAHLIIYRDVFGIGSGMSTDVAMCFDIALHLGTLLAILIYFCKDFIEIIKNGLSPKSHDSKGKLLWYIVIATIPAAIFGVLFEDIIEEWIRTNYILISLALAGMGIIIYLVDHYMANKDTLLNLTAKKSLLIGCSQVFALIPGFSRSGTTIAAGRAIGLKREEAAKFSFYLSAPIVLGAVCLQLIKKNTLTIIVNQLPIFIIGILTSFIIGLLCIRYLLKYLKNHDFKVFMWYRIILAIIVISYILVR